MSNTKKMQKALRKIAEIAEEAAGEMTDSDDPKSSLDDVPVCTPKQLPKEQLLESARNAVEINPVNAPQFGPMADADSEEVLDTARISVLTAKYWGPANRKLSVSFMESTPANLRARIIDHLNAWNKYMLFGWFELRLGGLEFVETSGVGDVRISRGPGGYWSYLGTDVMLIPRDEPTMNLQGFTMSTPESEFRRVVRHEAGHTLGFPHEHMRQELVARIDPQKAYDYFWRTQRWNRQEVDQQVLTPLGQSSIFGTPADQTSIMCYQLPGSITRDGSPIVGGADINDSDRSFALRIYPIRSF